MADFIFDQRLVDEKNIYKHFEKTHKLLQHSVAHDQGTLSPNPITCRVVRPSIFTIKTDLKIFFL